MQFVKRKKNRKLKIHHFKAKYKFFIWVLMAIFFHQSKWNTLYYPKHLFQNSLDSLKCFIHYVTNIVSCETFFNGISYQRSQMTFFFFWIACILQKFFWKQFWAWEKSYGEGCVFCLLGSYYISFSGSFDLHVLTFKLSLRGFFSFSTWKHKKN